MEINPIAYIKSCFPEKFGIPRQSGLCKTIKSKIVFLPEYRSEEAFRGLEHFSYIWLIWHFSRNEKSSSLTVRPPRLGGNKRVGVFASRSPFRPNPIGLSLVKLEKIEYTKEEGTTLIVSGADLMDNTPIFDIKPYLSHIESKSDALSGFAEETKDYSLKVEFENEVEKSLSSELLETFTEILSQDPRPAYQNDPERIYSFEMYGFTLSFSVKEDTLKVLKIKKL